MKRNLQKGFTLIELLVVIAIIGILSAIVIASLNTARDKAANASIKANTSGVHTQSEIVYDSVNPHSYSDLCTDPTIALAIDSITTASAGIVPKCFAGDTDWVFASTLKVPESTSTNFCADSTGKSIGITDLEYQAIVSDTTLCP